MVIIIDMADLKTLFLLFALAVILDSYCKIQITTIYKATAIF